MKSIIKFVLNLLSTFSLRYIKCYIIHARRAWPGKQKHLPVCTEVNTTAGCRETGGQTYNILTKAELKLMQDKLKIASGILNKWKFDSPIINSTDYVVNLKKNSNVFKNLPSLQYLVWNIQRDKHVCWKYCIPLYSAILNYKVKSDIVRRNIKSVSPTSYPPW